jgi:translation initiation factor 4G
MTKYLYDYLYAQYSEFREVTELTDQSILLEIEIVEQRCEERVRKAKEEAEKEAKEMAEEMAKEMVEEMAKEKAKEMAEEKTRTYRESLDEKDREIQRLTKILEEVKS